MALTTLNKSLLLFRKKSGKNMAYCSSALIGNIPYTVSKITNKNDLKTINNFSKTVFNKKIYTVISIAIVLLVDFGNP